MVVNAASWRGSHRALVEVKLAALEAGSLHLGAADGPPIQRISQPYAVTLEAAA
jgi:hypothetical protein